MRRVREVALGAYAHQELPFEKLVEALSPPRDPARNPLVQIAFQLFSTQAGSASTTSLQTLAVDRGTAVFDLVVTTWESSGGGVGGNIEYNTDLYDDTTIERMIAHFRRLLTEAVANPNRSLAEIDLLSEF